MIDIKKARQSLNPLQVLKLVTAAKMLKQTAGIFAELTNNPSKSSLLPLWAAGVISHGQPKSKFFEIGITDEAQKVSAQERTRDHLFRVTATAEYILSRASDLAPEDIENVLLERSLLMATTRKENNYVLKEALARCDNKDDWRELYQKAGVTFLLHPQFREA
jgi:hypothetical protein